jgi:hypothetical protein
MSLLVAVSRSAAPGPAVSRAAAAADQDRHRRQDHRRRAFDIHFDVGTIKTTAGPLEVTLNNKGAHAHAFKIEGTDLD